MDKKLTISEKSIPVWCYSSLWNCDIKDVNFCKLFWVTVLTPFGLLFLGVSKVLEFVLSLFGKGAAWGGRKAMDRKAMKAVLGYVPVLADHGVGFLQAYGGVVKVATGALLLSGLTTWAVLSAGSFLVLLEIVGVLIGAVLFLALFVQYVLFKLFDTFEGFVGFLFDGARVLQSRTCPKVEIVPKEKA